MVKMAAYVACCEIRDTKRLRLSHCACAGMQTRLHDSVAAEKRIKCARSAHADSSVYIYIYV